MKLKSLLKVAEDEANKSKHSYKHGAVIFKQGKLLSKGHNETHRGFSGYQYGFWAGSLHAEISALIKARNDVSGCSILVVRRGRRTSRPCGRCMAAIKGAGIKTLFYSNEGQILMERIK